MDKKSNIAFVIDRTTVTEGDVVELRWDCPGASHVKLTLDNGFKATAFDVAPSDSKKFRLNRTKGKTKMTLSVILDGKVLERSIRVRVKKMKSVRPHVVDDRGNRIKPLAKLSAWWKQTCSRLRYTWQTFSEKKQFAYKVLGLLLLVMLFSSFLPKLAPIAMLVLMIYLTLTIVRK